MTIPLRNLVPIVTALAVFVGGLFCACAPTVRAAATPVRACHAKAAVKQPCHEKKGEGSGCAHCQAGMNPKTAGEGATATLDLAAPTFAVDVSEFAGVAPVAGRATGVGVMARAEWTTLLRLHCALTT